MDCSPGVSQQTAEVNSLNSKLAYDFSAQLQNQSLVDSQAHARTLRQLEVRIAQNAATVDHLANVFALQSTATSEQTGQTEDQQTVDPVRTGTGDALIAPDAVAADAVSASIGNLATLSAAIVAQTLAAVLPILIASLGNGAGTGTPDPKGTA